MKFAYRNSECWYKGYDVDTVIKNIKVIKENIVNHLKIDKVMDQLSMFDPRDVFTKCKQIMHTSMHQIEVGGYPKI